MNRRDFLFVTALAPAAPFINVSAGPRLVHGLPFHRGGIVKRGHAVFATERGPELFVPLPNGRRVPVITRAPTLIACGPVTPSEVARAISKAIMRAPRSLAFERKVRAVMTEHRYTPEMLERSL